MEASSEDTRCVFCREPVCAPEHAVKSDPSKSISGFLFWNKSICYTCASELEELIQERRRFIERRTEPDFDWVTFTKSILQYAPKYILIFGIVFLCFVLFEFAVSWIKGIW